jgi:hypothetical protein
VIECFWDVLTESISGTSGTYTPSASVIGITPEQIAHGTFVRHFLDSVERSNVVESVNARWKTTVQAEDLIVDQCSQGKVVEEVGEIFPNIGVAVFSETFVVEAIHLGDLAGFVVSSKDGDAGGISDLEGNKEGHRLDWVVTTVDIVTYATSAETAVDQEGHIPMKR